MGKPPCCDKSNVKRGLWTAEEDAKILAYMANHGTGNWTLVPKKAGLNRCGKSCRLRWTNYLRPDLKHDSFSPQEEEIIINFHKAIGSRWSLIAKQLPGRTDNDVKNYWNTKLRKKLSRMGIDPVTHKPFSQIFSDFRNISGLPSTGNHIGKNINTLLSKQEPFSVLDALQNVNMNMKPTAAELVQDNTPVTNNPSWGFFAQLQAHNQEVIQPHSFTEVTSSCSSSFSSNITQLSATQSPTCQPSQAPTAPSSPFSWSEFLIDDPILNMDPQQQLEQEPQGMLSSTLTQDEVSGFKFSSRNEHNFNNGENNSFGAYNYEAINGSQVNEYTDASSSSTSSFVDAVLSKDSEMSSELFALLDGSFE